MIYKEKELIDVYEALNYIKNLLSKKYKTMLIGDYECFIGSKNKLFKACAIEKNKTLVIEYAASIEEAKKIYLKTEISFILMNIKAMRNWFDIY